MTRTDLSTVSCSIARTVALMTDGWSWLIVRDLSVGLKRFEHLRADLGISRTVLAQRLEELTEAGLVDRQQYQTRPPRYQYNLTQSGAALTLVLQAMVAWGDQWRPTGEGPPVRYQHHTCPGSEIKSACSHCGENVTAPDVKPVAGPGGRTGRGTALIGQYMH